ncbi:MAG TPA: thioesterase family protein [Nitrososphaeraceae archaeon]|jgi:predicted thioesterase|nr:thioesterase family protein [Nitrososphaeraceae archaeon]
MNSVVKVGATKERKIRIDSNQSTSFLWEGENVFSTPSMISEMEETCRLLLKEQFITDAEWDSVGTFVEIRHLAATPVGAEVLLKANVISVNGKRVMFDVEAFDRIEKIGEGRHERFIIDIPKFRARFIAKQKELAIKNRV